jgi:hypothetical protein
MESESRTVLAIVKDRKELLNNNLTAARDRTTYRAKRSYVLGLALLFAAVGSSAVSGMLGLLQVDSRLVGAIALLPGFATLLATTFKFQEKANWYYTRRDHLYDLYNRFAYTGPPETEEHSAAALKHIEAIANDWTNINYSLAEKWKTDLQIDWTGLSTSISKTPSHGSMPKPPQ